MIDTKNPCYGCDTGWGQADCTGTVKSCHDKCEKYKKYKNAHPVKVKYKDVVGDLVLLKRVIGYTEVCIDGVGGGTHYVYELQIQCGDRRICFDSADLGDIQFFFQ